jgi:septum formation protein
MSAKTLYLASRSERRQQLLRQIGVSFSCRHADVDETVRPGEEPAAYVERLAREKALAVAREVGGTGNAVLAADTAVVCEGEIFGKPTNQDDAAAMLRALSGRSHQVFTGVALADGNEVSTRLSVSEVVMRDLDDAMLANYWQSGEPSGKAGAYAIQGLGGGLITRLDGSYSGVMGLPLCKTVELLEQAGVGWALLDGSEDDA